MDDLQLESTSQGKIIHTTEVSTQLYQRGLADSEQNFNRRLSMFFLPVLGADWGKLQVFSGIYLGALAHHFYRRASSSNSRNNSPNCFCHPSFSPV
jgi:hypothetical protein